MSYESALVVAFTACGALDGHNVLPNGEYLKLALQFLATEQDNSRDLQVWLLSLQ